jgi:hypothetical protein
LRIIQKGVPDDATRIVLTGIERAPVNVVKLVAHLFPHALFGARRHVANSFDEPGKTGGVLGQAFGTQQEHGEHADHQKFLEGQTKHVLKITLRVFGLRVK